MKPLSPILFILLFIFIFSKIDYKDIDESTDPGYNKLLKWGLNNSLNITNKIKFINDKKSKKYVAKNLIPEEDVIMDIPPECMMNVKKTLSLLHSKKFTKAYKTYEELDKANVNSADDNQIDQTFLAFILYVVNHKKKSYEKNKFYEYYKNMFYMFEDELDSLPFYFSSEQMRFFLNTSFGSVFEIINHYINNEVSTYERKVYKKPVIYEEYLPYRIFTIQKSYDVNGEKNIVPYIDYIKKSFKDVNCELKVEDGHIIIKAIHNIFPGEDLVMKPTTVSNQHRFIFFGQTYDELLDIFPSYSIPTVITQFITNVPINLDSNTLGENGENNRVDLVQTDFYKKVTDVYKIISEKIGEDGSEESACKLLLKYLKKIRSNFDYVTNEDIRKAFFKQNDIDNVKRIIEGEKNFIDKKINDLKTYIKTLVKQNKEKEVDEKVNEL